MKHFLTALIVVALLFIGSGMAVSSTISASDLVKEVKQNQMKFDKTYNNRVLFVSGYAGELEEENGRISFELMPTADLHNPFDDIKCIFVHTYQKPGLLALNKGDAVVIRGKYQGKQKYQIHSLVLFDCAVLKAK